MTETEANMLLRALRERRSVRRFSPEPPSKEELSTLIEAAGWAPSAGNRQDWLFSVVTSAAAQQRMAEAVREKWAAIIAANAELPGIEDIAKYSRQFSDFGGAPVVIVVSATRPNSVQEQLLGECAGPTTGSATSAAMATQNLLLAAHATGLGACCMTGALAASAELAAIIGLDRRREIVCLVTVGRPAENPAAPPRKPTTEIMELIE